MRGALHHLSREVGDEEMTRDRANRAAALRRNHDRGVKGHLAGRIGKPPESHGVNRWVCLGIARHAADRVKRASTRRQ